MPTKRIGEIQCFRLIHHKENLHICLPELTIEDHDVTSSKNMLLITIKLIKKRQLTWFVCLWVSRPSSLLQVKTKMFNDDPSTCRSWKVKDAKMPKSFLAVTLPKMVGCNLSKNEIVCSAFSATTLHSRESRVMCHSGGGYVLCASHCRFSCFVFLQRPSD